jgi:hypothetical protein
VPHQELDVPAEVLFVESERLFAIAALVQVRRQLHVAILLEWFDRRGPGNHRSQPDLIGGWPLQNLPARRRSRLAGTANR